MIYVCNELEQWTEEMFAQQLHRIPEIPRQRILKQAQPKSRYQSLTGWLLLLYGYEQEWGRALPEIQILSHGKPSFVEKSSGYFNLSHSGSMSCCVIGERQCGVDVQERRKISNALIARCCNAEEIQLLEKCRGEIEQERLFALLWSRKEAQGKQSGMGISGDMKALGWCQDFTNWKQTGFSYMIEPDMALALCYEGERNPIQEQIVRIPLLSLFCKKSF